MLHSPICNCRSESKLAAESKEKGRIDSRKSTSKFERISNTSFFGQLTPDNKETFLKSRDKKSRSLTRAEYIGNTILYIYTKFVDDVIFMPSLPSLYLDLNNLNGFDDSSKGEESGDSTGIYHTMWM